MSGVESTPLTVVDPAPSSSAVASGQRDALRDPAQLWLPLALGFSLLFIARTMVPALAPDVVQGDARAHVFWLTRLRDPSLFPNDLIADFYQSISPPGYVALFRLTSPFFDPRLVSKLLPFGLGLVIAGFTFLTVRRLTPAPQAAFLATVLVSWYVWQYGQVASGTPHALLLPWLTVQVWALVARRSVLAAGAVVLGTLCYPVAGLLGSALLATQSVRWWGWPPRLIDRRSALVAIITALAVVGIILGSTQLGGGARFGPVLTVEQAQSMPDFLPGGSEAVLGASPYYFWLASYRTGLDLRETDPLLRGMPLLGEYAILAALLPLMLVLRAGDRPISQLSSRAFILIELLGISLALFLVAHLVLFQLYLPSRFVKYSLPLVLSIAGGLGLCFLAEACAVRWLPARRSAILTVVALASAVLLTIRPGRYNAELARDQHPTITGYVATLPLDNVVAATPSIAGILPYFAQRSIVISRIHAEFPWALGYYREARTRMVELIRAYYAESLDQLSPFLSRYNVQTILVDRRAYQRATFQLVWGGSGDGLDAPFGPLVIQSASSARRFYLLESIARCAAADDGVIAAVPVDCLRSLD